MILIKDQQGATLIELTSGTSLQEITELVNTYGKSTETYSIHREKTSIIINEDEFKEAIAMCEDEGSNVLENILLAKANVLKYLKLMEPMVKKADLKRFNEVIEIIDARINSITETLALGE